MELQYYNSSIKVDLLKFQSQVKSQAQEIELLRNKPIDLNCTQKITPDVLYGTDSKSDNNFEIINKYEIKLMDLNTMFAVCNRENQMMQSTIQGYTESLSELNSQLEHKKKEFMDV
jgi:hypothetical protein